MPSTNPFFLALTSRATWFDWLILVLAVWSIIRGLQRGLIRELFALVALLAGITAVTWNYTGFAHWLNQWISQAMFASVAAFFILTMVVTLGVLLAGRIVRSAAHLVGLGIFDRLAGGLFGLTRASLVGAAILIACTTFLPKQAWIERSLLAPALLRVAQLVAFFAPAHLQHHLSGAMIRLSHLPR